MVNCLKILLGMLLCVMCNPGHDAYAKHDYVLR